MLFLNSCACKHLFYPRIPGEYNFGNKSVDQIEIETTVDCDFGQPETFEADDEDEKMEDILGDLTGMANLKPGKSSQFLSILLRRDCRCGFWPSFLL
jgi:hypothetical protein